jgi:hypothetical protein
VQQLPVLSVDELDAQHLELLPARETLIFDINVAPVIGVNLALAINAATIGSAAAAFAGQQLGAFQG